MASQKQNNQLNEKDTLQDLLFVEKEMVKMYSKNRFFNWKFKNWIFQWLILKLSKFQNRIEQRKN